MLRILPNTNNSVVSRESDAHSAVKVREARELYHSRLITRFDTELPYAVKKF